MESKPKTRSSYVENKQPSWRYILGGAATLLVVTGVITIIPDIIRYMKIRSM